MLPGVADLRSKRLLTLSDEYHRSLGFVGTLGGGAAQPLVPRLPTSPIDATAIIGKLK
jgi:hypothetical protein